MRSVRTKILAITLVLLAFPGVAFIMYSITTTGNYKRLRLEGVEKTVEFEAEKINKAIAGIERGATNLMVDGLLFYQSQSYGIGETSVLEFLSGFPAAAGGGLWFEPYAFNKDVHRVSIYAFYDKDTGELHPGDIEEYNFYNTDWYREIVDEITRPYQIAWARPFVGDISQELKTAAGTGIFDHDGNLIGISVVDWGMKEALEELTAIHPTKNSFALLCVPQKDYIISDTYSNSLVGASVRSIPWDLNANTFLLDGIQYLSFSRYLDNGWLLSVQIPENEIFAEVESQNNLFSIIIAISLVIMICIAYWLVSKLVNAPLKQLTSDVAGLALGNLDMHVKVTADDEFGMLAETFNKMTAELKKALDAHDHEREEKKRIHTELSIAAEIQASMVPCIFPAFPTRSEFDIYASMIPAKDVGGDFYDFYMIDENNLAVVIADVSGKGIPAALFMVITKTIMKDCIPCKSPVNVFNIVNKKLCENNDSKMFVTALMGFFNIPTGRFVFVNAGHNPPLVKRGGNDYEFLRTKPCIVLGFVENAGYREEEIILEPGDTLYLYTDGVTEALNASREFYSEPRLLEVINKRKDYPPKELLSAIKKDIDSFTGEAEQSDDITMLALEISRPYGIVDRLARYMKEITVEAGRDTLNEVLDFICMELENNNCPHDLLMKISASAEEIFMNIVNYAYKQAGGKTTIGIVVFDSGREILLRFEDSGLPYNPLEREEPDLDTPLIERKIGNLGIFLVKKHMDTVNYVRIDNKNVLTMTKKIQPLRQVPGKV